MVYNFIFIIFIFLEFFVPCVQSTEILLYTSVALDSKTRIQRDAPVESGADVPMASSQRQFIFLFFVIFLTATV